MRSSVLESPDAAAHPGFLGSAKKPHGMNEPKDPGDFNDLDLFDRREPNRASPQFRPTVHSIWPCGSSVAVKTSFLFSIPNGVKLTGI